MSSGRIRAARDGMELAGTAEMEAAIEVMLFNETDTDTVDANGNWSLIVPRGDILARLRGTQFKALVEITRARGTYADAKRRSDEKARDPDGKPHYKVTLRVDKANLTPRQPRIEIRPGIQTLVELHTGEKTELQYLLKPLYKSQGAFREP